MLKEVDIYEPADIEIFIEVLKHLQSLGFKYIARDPGKQVVICYAAKPKKYYMENKDFFWGYQDRDLGNVKPAQPIWFDAPGINSNSKQATLIDEWIKVYGVNQ